VEKLNGTKSSFSLRIFFFAGGVFLQIVARDQLRAGGHSKRLEEALRSSGIEAEALVTLFKQMRGAVDAFGAGAAPFHFGRGESLIGVEVADGVGFAESGRGRLSGGGSGEGEREEPGKEEIERAAATKPLV